MSKLRALKRTSTLALRQRKAHLLRAFHLRGDFLRASVLERFLKCGTATCRCHAQGPKHGPFFYLNRCFAKGRFQSFLLKSDQQIEQARRGLVAYAQIQEVLDEISQINYELLRRGEALSVQA